MITVETSVRAHPEKVWAVWTEPEHIKSWCHASDDWGVPGAENDVRVGGKFKTTMAANDGSVQFDFTGVYTEVVPLQKIAYTMDDGRKVFITFTQEGENTKVVESFDPESENSLEMQRAGWQSILDNFKKYVEK